MQDINIWNNLLASLNLGCGLLATYNSSEYGASYSYCSSAGQNTTVGSCK